MLDHLGVDLDAGDGRIQRRRPQILQPGRARPDQDDTSGDLIRVGLARQHLPGRDVGVGVRRPELQPDAAVRVGWYHDTANLDVVEPGLAAEGLFATGVRRFEDVGAGPLRDPECLRSQAWNVLFADPVHQRHATYDLIEIGNPVDGTDPGGGFVERRQVGGQAGKFMHERGRIVAGESEAGFGRKGTADILRPRRGEHRGGLTDDFCKGGVVGVEE